MLKELCKRDTQWRKMALQICNNATLADDIVQDMYVKLSNHTGEVKDGFVYFVMKNIFLDGIKETSTKNREVIFNDFTNFAIEYDVYDIDKDQSTQLKIDIINSEFENNTIKKIIVENHINEGLRKFSRESKISINTIKKHTDEFKTIVWQRKKDLGI